MLGHLTWDKVTVLKKQLDADDSVHDNTVFVFGFTLRNETQNRKVYFKDFSNTIWRLFDHQLQIDNLKITRQDGTVIYEYHNSNPTNTDGKPSPDGGDIIKSWNSTPRAKRQVQLKMLCSQIHSYLKWNNGID